MAHVGRHCILEMYDCPPEMLDDPVFVKHALAEATTESGCTLIQCLVHKFAPQGVTGLALLAESHISVHTWPEAGYAAADVFTCGHKADPAQACAYLVRVFQAGHHTILELGRGSEVARRHPELFHEYPAPCVEDAYAVAEAEEGLRCPEPKLAPISG